MIHLLLQYFSSRGSSGKSAGGGYAVTARSGHMFEDEYDIVATRSQQYDFLQRTLPGLSARERDEIVETMYDWSKTHAYRNIRNAQKDQQAGRDYREEAYEQGQILENYISKAPKYSGEIYRGINVSESTADSIISTLSSGGTLDMGGTASWSSSVKLANDFAMQSPFPNSKGIVFKVSQTSKGTSIQHFSGFGKGESEVLVSKTAKYRAKSITDQGDRWYVELEEF